MQRRGNAGWINLSRLVPEETRRFAVRYYARLHHWVSDFGFQGVEGGCFVEVGVVGR